MHPSGGEELPTLNCIMIGNHTGKTFAILSFLVPPPSPSTPRLSASIARLHNYTRFRVVQCAWACAFDDVGSTVTCS